MCKLDMRCALTEKAMLDFITKMGIFFVYFILCASGFINFELWSQVTRVWGIQSSIHSGIQNEEVVNAITTDDGYEYAHLLRYYLVFPIFKLSNLLGIDYNYLFSLFFSFFILYSSLNISKGVLFCAKFFPKIKIDVVFILVFSTLCFISFFMNGRMIFAIMSSSLLVYISLCWHNCNFFLIAFNVILGVMFSSVSSGSFIVYFASLLCFFSFKVLSFGGKRNVLLLFFVLCLTALSYPFLSDSILKNIGFFGGGLAGMIGMLSHGFGIVFINSHGYFLAISVLVMIALLALATIIFLYIENMQPLIMFSVIALLGGLFGYSTLVMILLPVIAMLCYFLLWFVKDWIDRSI